MKVSILTSIYNDEETTKEFLTAMAGQKLPPNVTAEFLVCDDASTDSTGRFLTEVGDLFCRPITLVLNRNDSNLGQSTSLNKLYELSTGDVIVFIDADAIPDEDWLSTLIAPILKGKEKIVQGNFWSQYVSNTFVTREHEKWRRSAFLRRFGNTDGTIRTVNTRNLAIHRDVLQAIYDKHGFIFNPVAVCGADTGLGLEINQMGLRIRLCSKAIVRHADPDTYWGILKQKIHHGYQDGLVGISYPWGLYYAAYHPFVHDGVSLMFSIPMVVVFAIANRLGLARHFLKNGRIKRSG